MQRFPTSKSSITDAAVNKHLSKLGLSKGADTS